MFLEAERKSSEDETNEMVQRNAETLIRLKKSVSELQYELIEMARRNESQGILTLLSKNQIDTSKYKKATSEDIFKDLDCRIAEIVKSTDCARHEIQLVE